MRARGDAEVVLTSQRDRRRTRTIGHLVTVLRSRALGCEGEYLARSDADGGALRRRLPPPSLGFATIQFPNLTKSASLYRQTEYNLVSVDGHYILYYTN